MTAISRRQVAAIYGLAAHGIFVVGVGAMIVNLHQGLQLSLGTASGVAAGLWNALLVLQFPLLHSFLLSRRGAALLARLAPGGLGQALSTTTFAAIAALQLAATFLFWSPSGSVWWEPHGPAAAIANGLYAASWAFLLKALYDAGLPLQTGALGWTAVWRGEAPRYASFPNGGLYRWTRQPVYLGFALTLWTGPVWTPDRVGLALLWTAYCVVGPRLKERRYLRRHGEEFRRFQAEVPYLVPGRRKAA